MKIGQNLQAPLFEKMHKAHADAAKTPTAAPFAPKDVDTCRTPDATLPAPPLRTAVSAIAQKILDGQIKAPEQARSQVLQAIISDRWGDKLSPTQHRAISKALEQALLDDPNFSQEIDQMLILAAAELAYR
jgi:hypothetical protein